MTKIEISIPDDVTDEFLEHTMDYLDHTTRVDTYKITVNIPRTLASWGYEKLKNTITTSFTKT